MVGPRYVAGLHRLTANTFAYLQPPGTWGFSNCGLVVGSREALLVDTQFTLPMTARLREAIGTALPDVRVATIINTHANGDHCWGNSLFADASVVAAVSTAQHMAAEISPSQLAQLIAAAPRDSARGSYLRRHFGGFDFDGIALTPPSRTFVGEIEVVVGGQLVEAIEVGPAHTPGDVIVHVPDDGVVFAGDILFINDHPIMWTGPIKNWIEACDVILGTDARVIVPGHGPVTDSAGVTEFRLYLEYVAEYGTASYDRGMPYWQAAAHMPIQPPFHDWGHRERLVITLASLYRNLGQADPDDLATLFDRVGELEALASRSS